MFVDYAIDVAYVGYYVDRDGWGGWVVLGFVLVVVCIVCVVVFGVCVCGYPGFHGE